jgi:hypothetical protein
MFAVLNMATMVLELLICFNAAMERFLRETLMFSYGG